MRAEKHVFAPKCGGNFFFFFLGGGGGGLFQLNTANLSPSLSPVLRTCIEEITNAVVKNITDLCPRHSEKQHLPTDLGLSIQLKKENEIAVTTVTFWRCKF